MEDYKEKVTLEVRVGFVIAESGAGANVRGDITDIATNPES